MRIGVTLDAVSGLDATIPYTVSGTATGSGADHDLADGSLTITAGATTGSVSVTVSDDALDEDDETVVVTMTTGSFTNASAGATTEHTLTITDDDATPTVTFSASSQDAAEAVGPVTATVNLSAVSGLDVTVPYTVSGTATGSGTDHDLADGSLTISAGASSGDIAFTVAADTMDEPDESAIVTITTGFLVNATAGATTTHTVTVVDDDDAPAVTFSLASQSVAESAGTVSLSVLLAAESGYDVSVPYTVSGTATGSGTDHDLTDKKLQARLLDEARWVDLWHCGLGCKTLATARNIPIPGNPRAPGPLRDGAHPWRVNGTMYGNHIIGEPLVGVPDSPHGG